MDLKLLELKSDIVSEQAKAEGNKFYLKSKFESALKCYNKVKLTF